MKNFELHLVYFGPKNQEMIESIYLSLNNAIKRAMRLNYRCLGIDATKMDDWSWEDGKLAVKVETIQPKDWMDTNTDSLIPKLLEYSEVLQMIPKNELHYMKTQHQNRMKMKRRLYNLK